MLFAFAAHVLQITLLLMYDSPWLQQVQWIARSCAMCYAVALFIIMMLITYHIKCNSSVTAVLATSNTATTTTTNTTSSSSSSNNTSSNLNFEFHTTIKYLVCIVILLFCQYFWIVTRIAQLIAVFTFFPDMFALYKCFLSIGMLLVLFALNKRTAKQWNAPQNQQQQNMQIQSNNNTSVVDQNDSDDGSMDEEDLNHEFDKEAERQRA